MQIDYPHEWDELPKNERRKKIKELKRDQLRRGVAMKKWRNYGLVILVIGVLVGGYFWFTKESFEQVVFEQQIEEISLEGKVEEFPIEGREHVQTGTSVAYKTNPPTSGGHLGEAEGWGVYKDEITDEAAVHNLEHGGIWISYKDIPDEQIAVLEQIGKDNPGSVVVSPRTANDDKIIVASWGRMMKLESADNVIIQKYIDIYKNQSPEKLAR
jgi:hypothetical protein